MSATGSEANQPPVPAARPKLSWVVGLLGGLAIGLGVGWVVARLNGPVVVVPRRALPVPIFNGGTEGESARPLPRPPASGGQEPARFPAGKRLPMPVLN